MADIVEVEEQVKTAPADNPIPAADREKMRVLEEERNAARVEADDLRARVKDLEGRMKEADARRVLEAAVAGGKLTKEAVEAAGSPWFELAINDAKLAARIIETLPSKVGNVNSPIEVKEPRRVAGAEDAKLAAARDMMDREGITLFQALERLD